jgi:hypothetical protein
VDFEIGVAVALTDDDVFYLFLQKQKIVNREHALVIGETGCVTNALQRPQNMVVLAGPVRSMREAGVDVVPGTVTTHEIPRASAWHVRKRSEGRVVGEPEELMKEGNIVLLRD